MVAVDDPHVRADQAHCYEIPEALRGSLRLGCLVIVPFGRRLRRGWLVGDAEQAPVEAVKPLVAVLPDVPAVNEAQIALARWISRRANVGVAFGLSTATPAALLDAHLPRLRLAKGGAAARRC
jgi:primosomal protein N' (replication factor Y)